MENYKTTEEMAVEWGITPRHVQYLCRKGTIAGAIKRAHAWFIPCDTPIPVKYTKSNAKSFQFVGTKKKIFDNAIELFMIEGFAAVSLRDIADRSGISQSAIYSHFKSKQEILDTAYDFYCLEYRECRPHLEDLESLLQSGSLLDIIRWSYYDFKEEHQLKMLCITKIIFQRIAVDERAREIGKTLILGEGIEFVEEVFERAVASGRLAPLDTHAMAVLINRARIYTLVQWIVDPSPENMTAAINDEFTLYQYAELLLKDLNPPKKQD